MGTRLLVLGCLLAALAAPIYGATTQMWVWVDSKGVTHYSDRPVPGAKLISVATMEPSADVPPPAPRPTTAPTSTARSPQASTAQYELLEIFQPAENETFFNADAVVTVRIRSEPELVAGDRMRLYLDGNLVEGDPTALEYTLSGLERGAHSLRAQIVDALGKPKELSEPRMIHMRQNTVSNPRAVGPNLRPRPAPTPGNN
jgi:Domain of unknown function (DUF4124)